MLILLRRGLHSLTAVGDKLYLFAGAPKEGPMLGDLWALDTASSAWTELDAKGKTPHVRCSQAVAAVGSDIFMLGGSFYKGVSSGIVGSLASQRVTCSHVPTAIFTREQACDAWGLDVIVMRWCAGMRGACSRSMTSLSWTPSR